MDGPGSRRDFLRLAAGAAAAATGVACSSGSDKPKPSGAASKGARTLRIAQWSLSFAGIPAYDQWFDNEYTKRWAEEHGVRVVVDHLRLGDLPGRADAEVAAQAGHDIFGFAFRASPPSRPGTGIERRQKPERCVVETHGDSYASNWLFRRGA